jgi:hypothetical protein
MWFIVEAIERPTYVADGPRSPARWARMVMASVRLARLCNCTARQRRSRICGQDFILIYISSPRPMKGLTAVGTRASFERPVIEPVASCFTLSSR